MKQGWNFLKEEVTHISCSSSSKTSDRPDDPREAYARWSVAMAIRNATSYDHRCVRHIDPFPLYRQHQRWSLRSTWLIPINKTCSPLNHKSNSSSEQQQYITKSLLYAPQWQNSNQFSRFRTEIFCIIYTNHLKQRRLYETMDIFQTRGKSNATCCKPYFIQIDEYQKGFNYHYKRWEGASRWTKNKRL